MPVHAQRRIGLGQHQDPAERRVDRGDQERVVAPGERERDGAAGIAAAAVADPPFAPLGGGEAAADRAAETDRHQPAERVGHFAGFSAPAGSGMTASAESGGVAAAVPALG